MRGRFPLVKGSLPSSASVTTRQVSHIWMSLLWAVPANIQCLPSSLCTTRSMALFVPNGLLQRMQANGSSLLTWTGESAAGVKS